MGIKGEIYDLIIIFLGVKLIKSWYVIVNIGC